MRNILITLSKVIFICALPLLYSCAATMALTGTGGPLNVRQDKGNVVEEGQLRSKVINALSQPDISLHDRAGQYVDSYLIKGNTSPRLGRALAHLTMDVMTLGIWELLGTKAESSPSVVPTYIVTINYDREDKISKAQRIQIQSEIGLSPTFVRLYTEGFVYVSDREEHNKAVQSVLKRWEEYNAKENAFIASLTTKQLLLHSDLMQAIKDNNKSKAAIASKNLAEALPTEKQQELAKLFRESLNIYEVAQKLYQEEQWLNQQYYNLTEEVNTFFQQIYQEAQLALQKQQVFLQAWNAYETHRYQRQLLDQLNNLNNTLQNMNNYLR